MDSNIEKLMDEINSNKHDDFKIQSSGNGYNQYSISLRHNYDELEVFLEADTQLAVFEAKDNDEDYVKFPIDAFIQWAESAIKLAKAVKNAEVIPEEDNNYSFADEMSDIFKQDNWKEIFKERYGVDPDENKNEETNFHLGYDLAKDGTKDWSLTNENLD